MAQGRRRGIEALKVEPVGGFPPFLSESIELGLLVAYTCR